MSKVLHLLVVCISICCYVWFYHQYIKDKGYQYQSKKPFSRLQLHVKPIHYHLKLQPNLVKFSFTGEVSIDVLVTKSTDTVTIHGHRLMIFQALYSKSDGTKIHISADPVIDSDNETISFIFSESLPVGTGSIKIMYEGELNDAMKGFYRSKYVNSGGKEDYMATTQFEPSFARLAFPCWDEPAVKATFEVTLVVPKGLVALSNTPIKEEHYEGELRSVSYHTTPIMSTYLLAFVVGEFEYVSATDSNGVEVRVYTPVGKAKQGQFALDATVKILPFYANYFGIKYPLSKCDLIAIPDFAAGAMENWGLITFRDTALLVDSLKTSFRIRQRVAYVVAHELAHQWFGNLVTMEWWTHLWLNEGFATWVGFLAVDEIFPEYYIWNEFLNSEFSTGLSLDALASSHPIEVPVGHPDEIDEIFDAISYSKGASIIRMLNDYIGADTFRKGLNLYLEKFQYSNAATEDLWNSLENYRGAENNTTVQAIMNCWTKNMGFPLVSVTMTNNAVHLSQTKFVMGKSHSNDKTWNIPISIKCSSGEIVRYLMTEKHSKVDLPVGVTWVKVNSDSIGFFRVLYDETTFDSLLSIVKGYGSKSPSLSIADRLSIQSDVFALAKAGKVPTSQFLKLMTAYVDDDDYFIWSNIIANAAEVASLLKFSKDSTLMESYNKFRCNVLSKVYQRIGFVPIEGEGSQVSMLRAAVISTLGTCNRDVIDKSKKAFDAHCKKKEIIPSDLLSSVTRTVLRHGGKLELDECIRMYQESDMSEEKVRLLQSMGAVEQPELLTGILEYTNTSNVRSQDIQYAFQGCTGSLIGQELLNTYVKNNWDDLYKRLGKGFILQRIISAAFSEFASEVKADETAAFFAKNPTTCAAKLIEQCIESTRLRSQWLHRDFHEINTFLLAFNGRPH